MTNILATMKAELKECVDVLRPLYPDADEDQLHDRACPIRLQRYATGRSHADLAAEMKAKDGDLELTEASEN